MPTYYTSQLEDSNFNVKDWLKNKIPLALGIGHRLRDCPPEELTADEIYNANNQDVIHYSELINKTKTEIAEKANFSESDWDERYQQALASHKEQTQQEENRIAGKREIYSSIIENIKSKEEKSEYEFTREVLVYARKQLTEVLNFDYSNDILSFNEFPDTIEKFKAKMLNDMRRNLSFFEEKHKKAIESRDRATSLFKEYLNFIETNF